jgi:hypothetical protein
MPLQLHSFDETYSLARYSLKRGNTAPESSLRTDRRWLIRESVILRLVANSAFTRFGVNFYDQVKIVMFDCPIPKFQHLGKFVGRVDLQYWNGIFPKRNCARAR